MTTIRQNIHDVRERIASTARDCARSPEEVLLLAVSKTQPVTAIEKAILAGQRAFGENYVQEGVEKIHHFAQNLTLEWHFIGRLQSNKSRLVAEHFAWCHTVDNLKIAQRLNKQRPVNMSALNVLIQINISNESNKSGIPLHELRQLAENICTLPRLRLRGLMVIPAVENDYQRQLENFKEIKQIFLELKRNYFQMDTLSLGMSADMVAAIHAGSTLVRIGSAIFGTRDYRRFCKKSIDIK